MALRTIFSRLLLTTAIAAPMAILAPIGPPSPGRLGEPGAPGAGVPYWILLLGLGRLDMGHASAGDSDGLANAWRPSPMMNRKQQNAPTWMVEYQ